MQDHAGTVIGGITEVSRPYAPRSIRPEDRELVPVALEESEDSAQSSPTIMTFVSWAPPPD